MPENPTPSWEGEPVDLSTLGEPENRGPGYDSQLAKDLRAGKSVITRVVVAPSQKPNLKIVKVVVNDE